MIEAVILDFGGVVFKDRPKKEWLGPKDRLMIDDAPWQKATLGQVDDEVVFTEIAKNHGIDNPETIKDWLLSRREPNMELLELLSKLRLDIKKAVLNNGLKTLFHGYFKKYPELLVQFDLLVNSAEEGILKPDPQIYLNTCHKLKIEPGSCIFIDDNLNNIEGAKKIGMIGIYFNGMDSLKDEFNRLDLF